MTIVGYVRTEEARGTGPDMDDQLEIQYYAMKAYAEGKGYELADCYVDDCYVDDCYIDDACSEALKRPNLQRLLEDARAGKFQVVLVVSLDRLSNKLAEQLWVREELLRYNVEVWSASEPSESGGREAYPLLGIVYDVAEIQRSNFTAERSQERRAKASQGGYAGGRPPLGYTATKGGGVLTVDPAGAAAVRLVFSLRSKKLSMAKIAAILNKEGYTTTKGNRWRMGQVKRVLDREAFYRGHYTYKGITAEKGQQRAILGELVIDPDEEANNGTGGDLPPVVPK